MLKQKETTYRASRSGFDFLGVISAIIANTLVESSGSEVIWQEAPGWFGAKRGCLVGSRLHAIRGHPRFTRTRRPNTILSWRDLVDVGGQARRDGRSRG
jgi:uncharacterized YccA/Bax inhibitor family protein